MTTAAPETVGRSRLLHRPGPKRVVAALLVRLARSDRTRAARVADGVPRTSFLIMNAYGMGGTIRTVLTLAGHLAQDHPVTVLSVVRRRTESFLPHPPGVQVRDLDDATAERAGPARWLRRVLRGMPSVLVHEADWSYASCSLWTDLMIVRALRQLPAGTVIGTRPAFNMLLARAAPDRLVTVGQEHMNFQAHKPALASAMRALYPRLDALAVLTREDESDYRALLSGARTKVVRIPNALPELSGGRSSLTAKTVVAAGRLTPQKGFDLLLRAFAQVARQHPDWTLHLYGDGKRRGRLEQLVLDLGLSDRVRLMGRSPDLGSELAKGSVFVLSSRYEGFGMVIIEAMSKGLPVVSFDCPRGPAEIITDGQDGLLVPAGDVRGLAAGIVRLIEDPQLRQRLAAGAVQTAGRYDVRVVGGRWQEVLSSLRRDPGARALGTRP